MHELRGLPNRRYEFLEQLARAISDANALRCQRADLARRRLTLLRELAYFRGNDRESASVLAGARGLDRGIEGEEVGLVCDLPHRGDEAIDVGHGSIEGADLRRRALDAVLDVDENADVRFVSAQLEAAGPRVVLA